MGAQGVERDTPSSHIPPGDAGAICCGVLIAVRLRALCSWMLMTREDATSTQDARAGQVALAGARRQECDGGAGASVAPNTGHWLRDVQSSGSVTLGDGRRAGWLCAMHGIGINCRSPLTARAPRSLAVSLTN